MKMLRFRIIIGVLCMSLTVINAQKLEKKHTEKFNVNNDVVIDVNTRYTDIEIETWDKNEVVIEAYIDMNDEADKKVIDDYLKKWNFEALGNKSSIKISSKSVGLIDIHSFDFDSPNYDIFYAENVNDALENLHFMVPELPELPELPEMPELPEILELHIDLPELPELPPLPEGPTEFDFNAYKKNTNYLERWKKENEDIIGKNPKVRVGENSISVKSKHKNSTYSFRFSTDGDSRNADEIKERIEKSRKAREKAHIKRLEASKKRQEAIKKAQELVKERVKMRSEERKLALVKRQEAHERRVLEMKERRNEVRDILKKREKVKIKRIIKIKAPKGAKFNMNVKYGSMSFPK